MNTLLRKLAEWKGGRKAAQIIVFDGGAEMERTRAFLKGAVIGSSLTLGLFLLTAPGATDPVLVDEVNRRETLLREANARVMQAVGVADVCLNTAQNLERMLASYHAFLGNTPPSSSPRSGLTPPASTN